MAPIRCNHKSNVPKEDHFAILTFSTITIPGDERSRTNPGHGYPESTESVVKYTAYLDEAEWKAAIFEKMNSPSYYKDNFLPIKVKGVVIETSYNIIIK